MKLPALRADAPKIIYSGNRWKPTGVRNYDVSVNFGITRDF